MFAVDLGGNSVQIFIEKNAVAVTAESASIRTEENAIGNVEAAHRVILHPKGNVLVSWANEPSADQKAVVERCAGFS